MQLGVMQATNTIGICVYLSVLFKVKILCLNEKEFVNK